MSRPAKVELFESHSGAETMPATVMLDLCNLRSCCEPHTVLIQDIEALLDEQRRVEHDQAVADGQHIIARAGPEEGANCPLHTC